jgi:hypothetical protein
MERHCSSSSSQNENYSYFLQLKIIGAGRPLIKIQAYIINFQQKLVLRTLEVIFKLSFIKNQLKFFLVTAMWRHISRAQNTSIEKLFGAVVGGYKIDDVAILERVEDNGIQHKIHRGILVNSSWNQSRMPHSGVKKGQIEELGLVK